MQGNKVYVQKLGQSLFRIPMDSFNRPVPVQSVTEMPDGCFPMTLNSEAELRAHFPSAELIFITAPSNNTVVHRSPDVAHQVAAILKQSTTTPPTKTVGVAVETGELLASSVNSKQKAEEFLKRLQTALQYASKKHAPKLQHQIEIVQELISEIF